MLPSTLMAFERALLGYFFPKTWASSFDPTPSAPIFSPALVNPLLFVTRPSPVRPAPATILAVPILKIL